jgi:hypothetical protein
MTSLASKLAIQSAGANYRVLDCGGGRGCQAYVQDPVSEVIRRSV